MENSPFSSLYRHPSSREIFKKYDKGIQNIVKRYSDPYTNNYGASLMCPYALVAHIVSLKKKNMPGHAAKKVTTAGVTTAWLHGWGSYF